LNLARAFVERVSQKRVLLRHLPKDLGSVPLYVSPDASLQLWKLNLKSDLFDLARKFVHKGDTVWDIGANVGLFMTAAAHMAGPKGNVFAIEPDVWLVSLLQRTVAIQPSASAPIQVLPVAVAESSGIATLLIANRGRASNHLSTIPEHSQTGGTRQSVQVPVITMDWLLDHTSSPQLIKIDVEGAELNLFQGATRLLSEIRPTFMCEIQQRNQPEVTRIFKQNDYRLYDWDADHSVEIPSAAFNTLAIPNPR
jgi:FkbM family methyltransferase